MSPFEERGKFLGDDCLVVRIHGVHLKDRHQLRDAPGAEKSPGRITRPGHRKVIPVEDRWR